MLFLADIPQEPRLLTLKGTLDFQANDTDNDGETDFVFLELTGAVVLDLRISEVIVEGRISLEFTEEQLTLGVVEA